LNKCYSIDFAGSWFVNCNCQLSTDEAGMYMKNKG
jgi:hypothetical protein